MRVASLRCVDYLEWLSEEEDWLVFCLEDPGISPAEHKSVGDELQIVREIKQLVRDYKGDN